MKSGTPADGAAVTASDEAIREAADRIKAAGPSAPRQGRDPVNQPMINNWVEAIGDANPVYTDPGFAAASVHGGLVAPPAMAQVWTMGGLHPEGPARSDDPLQQMIQVLDAAGFTSIVATNCEQEYRRYLRHGERVSVRTVLEDVTGPKRTGAGRGLVRHHPEHLVRGGRAGRVDDVPGAEVPAARGAVPRRAGGGG